MSNLLYRNVGKEKVKSILKITSINSFTISVHNCGDLSTKLLPWLVVTRDKERTEKRRSWGWILGESWAWGEKKALHVGNMTSPCTTIYVDFVQIV